MARLTKKAQAQLGTYLAEQPPERLVELLLEQVGTDPGLKDRLLLEIARSGAPLDIASFRRSIADALRSTSGSRHDYPRTSGAWARRVYEAIAPMGELLEAGQAAAVIDLSEYALGRVDKAMGQIDDSSGWFRDIVAEIERVHHAACVAARPDPVALAGRLFALDVDGDWDILIDSVERYADVLGEDGISEMRRLADQRWAELPSVEPGGHDVGRSRPFHLSRMMKKLAEQAGDVDARVTVMAADLSSPLDYVEIAAVLADAGRHDDALQWAEKGIAVFDAKDHMMRADTRLDDVVLSAYVERGRVDDVVALVSRRFDERPGLAAFRRVKEWSTKIGVWDEQRPRLMAALTDDAERRDGTAPSATQVARRRWGGPPQTPPFEDLIAVLLFEGDVDAAWLTASSHGCTQSLWLRLAKARELDHPLDSVGVYKREVTGLIGSKQARTYASAVERIVQIGELYERAGEPDGFDSYIVELRQQNKPKTKFLGLLDAAGIRSTER